MSGSLKGPQRAFSPPATEGHITDDVYDPGSSLTSPRISGSWDLGLPEPRELTMCWVSCQSWSVLLATFCTTSQQNPVAISSHGRTLSGARPAWAQVLSLRLSLLLLREGRQAPGSGAHGLRGISPVLGACAPATRPESSSKAPEGHQRPRLSNRCLFSWRPHCGLLEELKTAACAKG